MKINRKHESDTPPTHTTFLEYIQTTPYLGKQSWNHCEILKIIKKPYCHRRHGATLRHAEAYLTGSSASQPVELWLSCKAEENQPSRKYGLPRFSNSPQGRRLNCWSHNGTSRKGSTDFNSKLYPCSIVLSSCKVSPWMACNLISFSCVKKLSTVVFLLSIMLPWIGKAPSPRILFLLAGARDVLIFGTALIFPG